MLPGSSVKRCSRSASVAAIAVPMAAVPACTNAGDSYREASANPTPAAWQEAIETSAISTGGVSTVPLAVCRAGEVAAVRDNGGPRDLLLIGADKSVSEIYAVPVGRGAERLRSYTT
jgi:hypothetical protein